MKPGFHHKADWSWKKTVHQSLFQPLVGVFDSRVLFLFSCQGRDYCSEEEDITQHRFSHSDQELLLCKQVTPQLKPLQRSVLFTEQHSSKRRPFHIVCPIKLQCFLMNLQRNIAKHKHTHTKKKTVLELSLLLLVKTCCNFSLLLCPSMQQNSAVHLKDTIGFLMLSGLFSIRCSDEL